MKDGGFQKPDQNIGSAASKAAVGVRPDLKQSKKIKYAKTIRLCGAIEEPKADEGRRLSEA
jgi:hypothetical protein